jgi:hypothetical protein
MNKRYLPIKAINQRNIFKRLGLGFNVMAISKLMNDQHPN